jgi:hypothetical protein
MIKLLLIEVTDEDTINNNWDVLENEKYLYFEKYLDYLSDMEKFLVDF